MSHGTMRQKFAKKTNEKAIKWLEANGFVYPYSEAKNIEILPNYVLTYFKHQKIKSTNNVEHEPGVE